MRTALRSTGLKRGAFMQDTRTGQIVKVAEIGGRDVMVKTAYKTDGIWVDPAHLVPVADPHVWGFKQLVWMLVALAAGVFTGYSLTQDFTAHGFATGEAVWYSVPGGFLSVWLVSYVSGLFRA